MSEFGSTMNSTLLPLLVFDNAANAPSVADSLARGGIKCAEVALRTPESFAALEAMTKRDDPSFSVGAGTVTSRDALKRSVELGAQFVVCPGLDIELVELALELDIPILPGVATASEVMAVQKAGLKEVKLFPASLLGGPAIVDAWSGPFNGMKFVPSGGVTSRNARRYLSSKNVSRVSGSWVASRDDIRNLRFGRIERLARRFTIRQGF